MSIFEHLNIGSPQPTPLNGTTLDLLRKEGASAKMCGIKRSAAPFIHPGMRDAWLDGYDAAPEPEPLAKRFEAGGPLLGAGDV